jgi:hypothetical protein
MRANIGGFIRRSARIVNQRSSTTTSFTASTSTTRAFSTFVKSTTTADSSSSITSVNSIARYIYYIVMLDCIVLCIHTHIYRMNRCASGAPRLMNGGNSLLQMTTSDDDG